jgi:hypothetical protein
MPVEYKTIRIPPDVYDYLLQLREKLRLRGVNSLPEFSIASKVTFGNIVGAALKMLDEQIEAPDEKKP